MAILFATLCFFLRQAFVSATALDDYVWKADENYGWVDMVGYMIIRTLKHVNLYISMFRALNMLYLVVVLRKRIRGPDTL